MPDLPQPEDVPPPQDLIQALRNHLHGRQGEEQHNQVMDRNASTDAHLYQMQRQADNYDASMNRMMEGL
jgi:hypothetical protein